jgi:tetratricopeptide (TPR) repeat protein
MVANIALILASQGLYVLVADLDLVSPSLHRYLAAFLPDRPADARSGAPLQLSCRFDSEEGRVDFIGPVTSEVAEPERFMVSRPDLLRLGYDIVLVDLPSGPLAAALAGELADVLVLGYMLNRHHMDRAVNLTRSIRDGARGADIQVLPVPMRVDQGASQTTARRRMDGHRRFAWLLDYMTEDERQRYWNGIEIPYEPEYSAEEGLPFLDPPSPDQERLVGAYLRVARTLVPDMPDVPPLAVAAQTVQRYREARREAVSESSTVTILHAAADRYWAEWLAAALELLGFTAIRRRIDQVQPRDRAATSALIVVSARLLSVPGYEHSLQQVIGPVRPDGPVPVGVSIDGQWLSGDLFLRLTKVDLSGRSEREATEELVAYYQITSPGPLARNPVYFPGRRETVSVNLPPPTRTVVGRDDLVDQVRDYFTAEPGLARLTLTGPAGMGKTLVALEYAWRFRAAYDIIVLIRADSAAAVRADLAKLVAKEPPKRPAGDPGAAALSELGSGVPSRRWLLICIGTDDPSLLAGLLPTGGQGHILLTAREEAIPWSRKLPVTPLTADDAKAMVVSLVKGIRPAEAEQVAASMRGTPLALQLACAWIQVTQGMRSQQGVSLATVTDDTAREFLSRFATITGGSPAAAPDPVRAVVGIHLDELGDADLGAAVLLLLETCAFLGSSGLSWRLLVSPEMLAQLAGANSELTDPILLRSVLHKIASRGLLLLDDAALLPGDTTGTPLQVHPRVLDIIRDRLTPQRRAEAMWRVSKMLAASAPLSVDDDVIRDRHAYADLLEHVEPSGAAAQPDYAVRQWLVNEVRYLWQSDSRSSWDSAVTLGEGLLERWRSAPNDPLVLRLQTQLANVYRSLGQFDRARETDKAALDGERRILGLQHQRTLMTARSYGADLRLVGNFEGALLEDNATFQAVIQLMGRNHLLAILTSGNLALSELLAGELEEALERRRDHDLPWCERFEGERPWETAWVLGHIGALQRELGLYQESLDSLRAARGVFQRAANGTVPVPSSLVILRIRGGIAVAERHLGRPDLKADQEILEECRTFFGDGHELVPATLLSLAGDFHALGDHQLAVQTARDALDQHTAIFGERHPFTAINQVDLSIYALAAGQRSLADGMSRSALALLESQLPPGHLWAAAAVVARSNVLAITDELDEAGRLEKQARAVYRERLGAFHEFTKVAEANIGHTERLRNETRPVADPAGETAQRRAIELDIPPH